MRKTIKLSLIAASVLALTACNDEAKTEKTEAVAATAQVELNTLEQQQAYAFGSSVGSFLGKDLERRKELGFDVDLKLLLRGLEDSLKGESQYDEVKVNEILTQFEASLQEKQEAQMKAEAEKNIAAGTAYLAENAKKEGVKVTESGLQYKVISLGEGAKPAAEDTVKVHYKGTLLDGTEFDSSYARNEPATFPLNRVILGWTEGLQLMPVGSKFEFTIPSDLAYGPSNKGPIPANSTLIFEVELLAIESDDAAAE
ncbi:FKBP-type peptidyl-prolyl cis-trans isomerase [Pseudoalteromonas sp. MMG010]|uniref:FKBP-type peptidyl-prolyl cis-trans isomerase n=1 Tax=Pseudoalteromonas sp. MMG010 TaxID=2822685 RepID=UPI001B3A31B2|nr:FKBP-type peptidyl-prolyl cis-trans isomerase [Pseudoalteromonas sp. MMG010]MBQ4834293.1 FKBP-type peptidyl-prolyl cis-trans isomerase [Pseudoalteromonas sp. MMG010]